MKQPLPLSVFLQSQYMSQISELDSATELVQTPVEQNGLHMCTHLGNIIRNQTHPAPMSKVTSELKES